jgi:hypothetical protein
VSGLWGMFGQRQVDLGELLRAWRGQARLVMMRMRCLMDAVATFRAAVGCSEAGVGL